MLCLPARLQALVSGFSIAFTRPTFQRVMLLFVGMLLTRGRRTVTGMLLTVGGLADGHFGSYHRVFSRSRWLLWPLAKVLTALVLELVPTDDSVVCAVDDTLTQHRGKNVYGKARHRDPCRATRSHTVWLWGHKWVVLSVNVKFAFAKRPWALPVLAALYRGRELNQQEGRIHKTPIELAMGLMAALLHWFPQRKFILLGDGGYASHELAAFCHRHRRRLTLVSLLHPRAHLRNPPAKRRKGQMGRIAIRGAKLPHPQDVVAKAPRQRATVNWYGGNKRRLEFVTETGHWYKATEGLVPIRWVFIHDIQGTYQDRYFYSTDPKLSASAIIALYTSRWNIEVMFQECKEHLGLTSPRNWKKQSVLRTVPCLLGCYSLVCLLFHKLTAAGKAQPRSKEWYPKSHITFSDALAAVRRSLWCQTVFAESKMHDALKKLPAKLRNSLLDQLSLTQ